MENQQAQTLPDVWQPASAEWIVGRAQVLLSHYFQPDTPQDVTEEALADWVDMLFGQSERAINYACRTYLQDQPRRRPTPGAIRARAQSHTNLHNYAPPREVVSYSAPPEPERIPVDPETANRIVEEAGFDPRRNAFVKKFPMARSMQEAEEMAIKPKEIHWSEKETPDSPRMQQLKAARRANALINPEGQV